MMKGTLAARPGDAHMNCLRSMFHLASSTVYVSDAAILGNLFVCFQQHLVVTFQGVF
jgi:hypothetical protein